MNLKDFAQGDPRSLNNPTVSRSKSLEESSIGSIPLHLARLSLGNAFRLDLPVSANVPAGEFKTTALVEVGNSKILQHFHTDGPVLTTADDTTPSPSTSSQDPPRCRHCAELVAELTSIRQRLSRAEDEFERNFRGETVAENTVTSLKQDMKTLKAQLRHMQTEIQALREDIWDVRGGGGNPPLEMQAQRLAQDLRVAASTAEHSFRSNSLEESSIRSIPLDLPGLSLGNAFPLDLPVSANVPAGEFKTTPLVEVGDSKSLQDFHTDGPVRTIADDTTPSPTTSSQDSPICLRCAELVAELTSRMQRLSRAEDEFERNFREETVAENTVTSLKQDMKTIKAQLRQILTEIQALREDIRDVRGGGGNHPLEMQAQRLAQDLRVAASTAEHSFRSNSLEESSIRSIPLDLPGLSLGNAFPLDLPVSANLPAGEFKTTPLVEVGNSKILQHFHTDGPVRTTADDTTPLPSTSSQDPPRCRQCAELVAELTSIRQRLSRAEDEFERNFRGETVAENTVTSLKQDMKTIKAQLRQILTEIQALREDIRDVRGGGGNHPLEMQAQRLAQDLRVAASTAEHSFRSFLTDIDNLRIMVFSLGNNHRREEKPSNRFSRYYDV